jgi:hypothetical protein
VIYATFPPSRTFTFRLQDFDIWAPRALYQSLDAISDIFINAMDPRVIEVVLHSTAIIFPLFFSNLDDIEIYGLTRPPKQPSPIQTSFRSPLRDCEVLYSFDLVGTWTRLIAADGTYCSITRSWES